MKQPIETIMTRDLFTITTDDGIDHAESLMRSKHIRHLPVMADEKLVGIISLTDLQRLSFASAYGEEEFGADAAISDMLTVGQTMVANPVVVQSDQSIQEVAKILAEKEFHALPVMKGDLLIGIVTTTDLIRFLISES